MRAEFIGGSEFFSFSMARLPFHLTHHRHHYSCQAYSTGGGIRQASVGPAEVDHFHLIGPRVGRNVEKWPAKRHPIGDHRLGLPPLPQSAVHVPSEPAVSIWPRI